MVVSTHPAPSGEAEAAAAAASTRPRALEALRRASADCLFPGGDSSIAWALPVRRLVVYLH